MFDNKNILITGGTGSFGKKYTEILPEHVLLDSANLPSFDRSQLEGRVTGSVDSGIFKFLFFILILICSLFGYSAFKTQVIKGAEYATVYLGSLEFKIETVWNTSRI